MTWTQNYDPFGSWPVSTLVAALPVLVLLGLIASGKVGAWQSALCGLITAVAAAVFAFGMPVSLAAAAAGYGVIFAAFRIVWLIVAAVFTKCRANLAEMEPWYYQWIRALGAAVVRGPSDFCGKIADVAVADMAPSGHRPCARLASRITILSDGTIVPCEQDVCGQKPLGKLGRDRLTDVWKGAMQALRSDHLAGSLGNQPLCASCREWHRP